MVSALAAWHPHTTVITAKCTQSRIKRQAAQTGEPLYGDVNSQRPSFFRLQVPGLGGACSESCLVWPKILQGALLWAVSCRECKLTSHFWPRDVCCWVCPRGLWETDLHQPHLPSQVFLWGGRGGGVDPGNTGRATVLLVSNQMDAHSHIGERTGAPRGAKSAHFTHLPCRHLT